MKWKIRIFLYYYQKSIEIKIKLFQFNRQYLEIEEKLNKDFVSLTLEIVYPYTQRKETGKLKELEKYSVKTNWR